MFRWAFLTLLTWSSVVGCRSTEHEQMPDWPSLDAPPTSLALADGENSGAAVHFPTSHATPPYFQRLSNVAVRQKATLTPLAAGSDARRAVDTAFSAPFAETRVGESVPATIVVDLPYNRIIAGVSISAGSKAPQASLSKAVLTIFDDTGKAIARVELPELPTSPAIIDVALGTTVYGKKVELRSGATGRLLSLAELEVWGVLLPNQDVWTKNRPPEGICWKKSYGRGVGTIPSSCPSGEDKDGSLCYASCRSGYDGDGPVCWKDCPEGYKDDGLFCRKPGRIYTKNSYGRGAGTLPNIMGKCSSSKTKQDGLCYKRCDAGYKGKGPVCWRTCDDGYKDDGATCRRDPVVKTQDSYGRGVGSLLHCSGGKKKEDGLCYEPCREHYSGLGAFCLNDCSDQQYDVDCGFSCASGRDMCEAFTEDIAQKTAEMIGNVSLMVAGFGQSGKAVGAVAKASGSLTLAQRLSLRKDLIKLLMQTGYNISKEVAESAAQGLVDAYVDGVPFDWASLDPTGITAVCFALAKPIC